MGDFFAKGNKPINGYGSPSPDYSTTEHKTGKKWIDGNDIWEKTVDFGALPNATSKAVSSGISNLNMLVDMRGIAKHATASHVYLILPYVAKGGTDSVAMYFNGGNIIMNTTANMATDYTKSWVTLQYTKTE